MAAAAAGAEVGVGRSSEVVLLVDIVGWGWEGIDNFLVVAAPKQRLAEFILASNEVFGPTNLLGMIGVLALPAIGILLRSPVALALL